MIINEKKQNGRIYVYAAVIYENKRLYWKKNQLCIFYVISKNNLPTGTKKLSTKINPLLTLHKGFKFVRQKIGGCLPAYLRRKNGLEKKIG